MTRRVMICLLFVMLSIGRANAQLALKIPEKHPYLFVDASELAAAKSRMSTDPWARKVADDFIAQADSMLKTPIRLPAKGDAANDTLSDEANHLAMAYLLSGDKKYAEKAREILLMYADAYNKFPLTNLRCRVMSLSSLMEATWFRPLVLAYDEVADSGVFTPQEKAHIERDLLRSAVKQFMIENYSSDPRAQDLHYRCYNFQAWHISCVGLVGLCLHDQKMISYAVDGPYGFKHLISHDVRDDGLFWERSLAYHFFVIDALLPLTEAACHCGLDLYHLKVPDNITKDEDANYVIDGDNGPKTFKMMFDAPFYFAFPDLSYADVADSTRGPLAPDLSYKIAYQRYHDPKYAWLLNKQWPTNDDSGGVGFLHYYRHSYTYSKVRISEDDQRRQSPQWARIDDGYEIHDGLIRADDGMKSTLDEYILTKQDFKNFILEWDMTREADSGNMDRAFVVWHVWRGNPNFRKSLSLVSYCPEIGRTYHFRLEVHGDSVRLLRDGKEMNAYPTINAYNGHNYYDLFFDAPKRNEGRYRLDGIGTGFCNNGVLQGGSSLFPSSGFAVLRELPDAATGLPNASSLALNFNCGPYGGGHGHPDKLSIVMYADGRQWLPDFGSCGYDSPLKGEWTSQTVSHNTVVVDGVSQYPSGPNNPVWPTDNAKRKAIGQIDLFHADPVMGVTSGWSDSVYPGVRMRRTLVHLGGSILDVFNLKSSEQHTYDYVLHIDGDLVKSSISLDPQPGTLSSGSGYQLITDVRHAAVHSPWTTLWRENDSWMRLFTLPGAGSEVYLANSITTTANSSMPMMLVRRKAADTAFVSVMLPSESGTVRQMKRDNSLLIDTTGGKSRVYLRPVKGVFQGELGVISASGKDLTARTGIRLSAVLINGTKLRVGDTDIITSRPMTLFIQRRENRWIVTQKSNGTGRVSIGRHVLTIKPGHEEYELISK